MATIDRGDHDDADDDDSKCGDVDDFNGDCSAWRLSVPYRLSTLFVPLHFSRLTGTQSSLNSPIK